MYKSRKNSKDHGILIALIFLLLVTPKFHNEAYPESTLPGKPTLISEYSDYTNLSIDQILATDDTVYVLYDDHRGIIQAFNSDGSYLYTVTFFKHANGAFRMAVHDEILYVKDCVSNIYSLKDGDLIAFYERDAAPQWIHQLDYSESSHDYQIRLGSVWCVADGGEYCMIERPVLSALYQNNLLFLLALTTVIIIGFLKTCRLYKASKA